MVEERITTVEGTAAPTTHTTIIHETQPERRSGSGIGMLFGVVLVIAAIAGIYIYSQGAASESAKDNAIAGAASSVGDAAKKVGNAAESAADKVGEK